MIDILDFLSSFIDKIGAFFTVLVSLPSRIEGLINFISFPFIMLLGDVGSLIAIFLLTLISFLLIYCLVKLVLSIL